MSEKYLIKTDDNNEKYITSGENISFYLKRGFTVQPEDIDQVQSNTILIDGVYNGPPFLDNQNKKYSLDHHSGVVRSFTLSSCEQALILLYKGFNLNQENWFIIANEADLDTILVAWIFFNNAVITQNENNIRHDITKLVRVEGLIDSQGFSVLEYLGYSEEILHAEMSRINILMEEEKKLKEEGVWSNIDPIEYILDVLLKIDVMIFASNQNEEINLKEIDVINIDKNNLIVMCKASSSIYDIEKVLREKYKNRLAVIVLQNSPNRFTLKLANEFLDKDLLPLYEALNKIDKNVDLTDPSNLWGGSDLIGGSPRQTGTNIDISTIGRVAGAVFKSKNKLLDRFFSFINR